MAKATKIKRPAVQVSVEQVGAELSNAPETSPFVDEKPNDGMPEFSQAVGDTVTFEAKAQDVAPIATTRQFVGPNVEKVAIVNVHTGRILAQAVKRNLAERMVKENPNLKIG